MALPAWLHFRQNKAQREAAALIERLRRCSDPQSPLARICALRLLSVDPGRLSPALEAALSAPRLACEGLAQAFAEQCQCALFSQENSGPAWARALACRAAPFPPGSLGERLAGACERARAALAAERALRSASSGCSGAN